MSLAFSKCSSTCQSFANSLDHLLEGGSRRSENKVVRFLGWISETTTNEHPMSSIILPLVQHGDNGPVEEPGAFGTFAHRQPLPISIREHQRFDQCSFFASASGRCLESDRFGASPQPSRRDTHALLARYAGPDCHRKRYQPRPSKWGSELAKYVRSCLGPVLALSGSELMDVDACGSTAIAVLTPV
jgi:hypothetical protein